MKRDGVRVSLIAKILHRSEGISVSATYYHLSDNRQAYCNDAKKVRQYQRARIQERIRSLIDEGYNTSQIAEEWNVPLTLLNRLYVK